jgi:hypothetical protein
MNWLERYKNRKKLRLKEGTEVIFNGHNAVVLDHPYAIKYHISGKFQWLNEKEILSLTIIKEP